MVIRIIKGISTKRTQILPGDLIIYVNVDADNNALDGVDNLGDVGSNSILFRYLKPGSTPFESTGFYLEDKKIAGRNLTTPFYNDPETRNDRSLINLIQNEIKTSKGFYWNRLIKLTEGNRPLIPGNYLIPENVKWSWLPPLRTRGLIGLLKVSKQESGDLLYEYIQSYGLTTSYEYPFYAITKAYYIEAATSTDNDYTDIDAWSNLICNPAYATDSDALDQSWVDSLSRSIQSSELIYEGFKRIINGLSASLTQYILVGKDINNISYNLEPFNLKLSGACNLLINTVKNITIDGTTFKSRKVLKAFNLNVDEDGYITQDNSLDGFTVSRSNDGYMTVTLIDTDSLITSIYKKDVIQS